MWGSIDDSVEHPRALKIVLGLGGIFVLVLLGVRLTSFGEFAQALWERRPFLLVEPGTLGNLSIVVGLAAAALVFLFPRAWRKAAWAVLFFGSLLAVGISGNSSARGGSGLSHTPLAHWLQSRGYARCPARDQIRLNWRGGHSSEYVAEGWAQPGACSVSLDTPGRAQ